MPGTIDSILSDHCRLDRDRPILAGVSGGPDSLCLLSSLYESGWKVIAAHFNHMLRLEAEEEAAAVEALSSRLGIPFAGGKGDVREYSADEKLSLETAARALRYRFLFAQAHRYQAQAVAVGHTADDQVETVLMHFLRGAGLNGLKGMPYCTTLQEYDAEIPVVRPLLDLWRSETVAYCAAHDLQVHYDLSNDSLDFLRNRVRHELIPALETYNPRFREALWRTSRTLAADQELLNAALEPLWQQALLRQAGQYISLNLNLLSGQPPGAQMHLLRRAVQCLIPGHDIGYSDLQRAVAFLADPGNDRADFTGGLFLLCEVDVLYVASSGSSLPTDQWPQMPEEAGSQAFESPFSAGLASGWRFLAESCALEDLGGDRRWEDAGPLEAWLDLQSLPGSLELRVRRAGDRFEPLGMAGHSQKLSDFFVNAKLPARARERWPLVCAGDEVLWVPGYRPAHLHRVQPRTTQVLHLRVLPPE
jgi:tRNA(Ile)-lysidine synthase